MRGGHVHRTDVVVDAQDIVQQNMYNRDSIYQPYILQIYIIWIHRIVNCKTQIQCIKNNNNSAVTTVGAAVASWIFAFQMPISSEI